MTTEYDVRARLTLDAKQADKAAKKYGDTLTGLGSKIKGTQNAMGGMLTSVAGVGLAYVGLNAGINVFRNLTKSAIEYTASLETTRIGLASILSIVEKISYKAAKGEASKAFDVINKMAVESPAGPKEMFEIFQGIVGPIRGAGAAMQTVYDMTGNTVLAATALNVDLAQAKRDIGLMVRGTAGLDTKMFAILTSMGMIKENAEKWNKELTAAQRVEKLQKVLSQFAESGEDFGKSFAGATATFSGLVDEYKRAFMTPIMDRFAARLVKINDYLMKNNDHFTSLFRAYGYEAANAIETAVGKGIQAFKYLKSHWGEITNKWRESMGILETYGPMLGKVVAGVAAVQLARGPAGAAVGAVGAVAPMVAGVGKGVVGAGLGVSGAVGRKRKEWKDAFDSLGHFSAGEYGSTMGAAATTAGAAVGAKGTGTAAAGTAAATGVSTLAIALLAIGAIATAVYYNFDMLQQVFGNLLEFTKPLGGELTKFGKNLWSFLRPALEMVGLIIIATLVPAWKTLVGVFQYLMPIFQTLGELLAWIGTQLDNYVMPALRSFIKWLADVKDVADPDSQDSDYSKYRRAGGDPRIGMFSDAFAEPDKANNKTPESRSTTTINVDKMIIKQTFKGDKDPDRVLAMMMNDITKQAERRVSSRFTGALTR